MQILAMGKTGRYSLEALWSRNPSGKLLEYPDPTKMRSETKIQVQHKAHETSFWQHTGTDLAFLQ